MRRRIVRPFGSSIPVSRAFSMLILLAVLGALYDMMRQPASWNWLSANEGDRPSASLTSEPVASTGSPAPEKIIAGPNDLDPAEWAEFQSLSELVTDKSELRAREMLPYWKLLEWSHTQSLAELEQRARQEPALVQIWNEPAKYRGKPIRLRLHVRRVLEWETDASKNGLGASKVYEVMGWTDETKSLPYMVVLADKPPELPVGNEVEAEIVFVGYFLKIMTYQTFDDKSRGTPLLLGRARVVARTAGPARPVDLWQAGQYVLGGGLLVVLFALVVWWLPRGKKRKPATTFTDAEIDRQWVPLDDTPTPPLSDFAAALARQTASATHPEQPISTRESP